MFPALPLPSGIPRTHRLQWRNRFAALVPKSRPMSWNPGSTADTTWPQGSLCSFLSPSPQPPHMPLGLFFSWRTGFRNEVIRARSCKQGMSFTLEWCAFFCCTACLAQGQPETKRTPDVLVPTLLHVFEDHFSKHHPSLACITSFLPSAGPFPLGLTQAGMPPCFKKEKGKKTLSTKCTLVY